MNGSPSILRLPPNTLRRFHISHWDHPEPFCAVFTSGHLNALYFAELTSGRYLVTQITTAADLPPDVVRDLFSRTLLAGGVVLITYPRFSGILVPLFAGGAR